MRKRHFEHSHHLDFRICRVCVLYSFLLQMTVGHGTPWVWSHQPVQVRAKILPSRKRLKLRLHQLPMRRHEPFWLKPSSLDGIARACSSVALLCYCAISATAVHGSQQEVGFGGQLVRGSLEDDFEGSTSTIRDMGIEQVFSPLFSGRSLTIRCQRKAKARVNPRMQARQCRAPRFPSQTSTQTSS